MSDRIQEDLKKLPDKPGVYIMHGAAEEILYVGKAKNLKNRVRQYFQKGHYRSPKIEKMISQVAYFEYIMTDSETEALVLECNLIKENMPPYNTMLKDSKSYPYIRVTLEEAYPRVMLARQMKKDRSRYFGPFPDVGAVKDILALVHRHYRIRTCNRVLPRDEGKERPCLNYHIHQCDAPCQGYVTPMAYGERIQGVIQVLNGHYEELGRELQEKMNLAAENLDFEEAIAYRDLLESLQRISKKQKLTDGSGEDRDIIAMAREGAEGVAQVFFVREGKMIGREHFHLQIAPGDSDAQVLGEFVKQYYAGTPYIPREILVQQTWDEMETLGTLLEERKGRKVLIRAPKIGEKEKLVELAARNARMVLDQDAARLRKEYQQTMGALQELAELLDIPVPSRMEAYDISNISGFASVGSMVVYEQGRPKKADYRKFRIKWVIGANDYASLAEVLSRRFNRAKTQDGGFVRLPDLIMMDGGKGQVHIAEEVLEKMGMQIPICGMVKDDKHRTRGLYFKGEEVEISTRTEAFRLITRIQDEAHRFAITYHRSLRSREQTHSVLEDIPGIGPKRRMALMRTYSSLEELQKATVEELGQVEGMNEKAARSVWNFFRK